MDLADEKNFRLVKEGFQTNSQMSQMESIRESIA